MTHRLGTLLAGAVATLVLVACANGTVGSFGPGLFVPTLPSDTNAYPAALAEGTLVEDSGCLFLRSSNATEMLLLWPPGYSAAVEDGAVVVRDGEGAAVAKAGDQLELGGGLVGESRTQTNHAEQLIGQTIPARCLADGGYWFTAPLDPPS
jgi:hypothetical protein